MPLIPILVTTSQRETYVTIVTKGTLALICWSEEFKHNLEKHIESQFSDPLC
jgi:hypothetical protein